MHYFIKGGHYCGWADARISMLASTQQIYSGFHLLVTCLDSCSKPATLRKWKDHLRESGIDYDVIGNYVWINSNDVYKLFISTNSFYGYDEIYLYKDRNLLVELPSECFTGDRMVIEESSIDEFYGMFIKSGATRYFSDGDGLNFVCEDITVVKHIGRIELEAII